MTVTCNADGILVLDGGDAILLLRAAIEKACSRIWVQQFVVDVRPGADRSGMMRYMLHALAEAARRGVDVRVLLPVVTSPSGDPYDLNLPAVRFLARRGVAVRRYRGSRQRPHQHAKVVIVDDDFVSVGNFNWTTRAFRENTEQGLAIRSSSITSDAAARFDRLWRDRACAASDEFDPFLLRFLRDRGDPYWPRHRARLDPYRTYPRFERRGRDLYGKLVSHVRSGCTVRALHGQRYAREVEAMIRAANARVQVAMSAMRASTDRRLRALPESLEAATRRGVDVRVLYQVRDWPTTDLTADVEYLRRNGVLLRPWPVASRMHLRSVIVDDRRVVVGSVGWTPQSIYLSEELSMDVSDRRTAMAFAARFDAWWALASKPVRAQRPVAIERPPSSRSSGGPVAAPSWSTCDCPCSACVPDASEQALAGGQRRLSRGVDDAWETPA